MEDESRTIERQPFVGTVFESNPFLFVCISIGIDCCVTIGDCRRVGTAEARRLSGNHEVLIYAILRLERHLVRVGLNVAEMPRRDIAFITVGSIERTLDQMSIGIDLIERGVIELILTEDESFATGRNEETLAIMDYRPD